MTFETDGDGLASFSCILYSLWVDPYWRVAPAAAVALGEDGAPAERLPAGRAKSAALC